MPYALTPTAFIRANSLSRRPSAKRHVVERRYDEEDPDALFLRSLLPNLKALPDQEKTEAKVEIMQVLCRRQFGGVRPLQLDSP